MAIRKYEFTDLAREIIRHFGNKNFAKMVDIKNNRLHQIKCVGSPSRSTFFEREAIIKKANELLKKDYKEEDLFEEVT